MRQLLIIAAIAVATASYAADTVFSPFTGKPDYIAQPGTGGAVTGTTFKNYTSGAAIKFVWSAGKAGGQTLNGGTAAGENLTLSSTSNATKGKLLFGTSAYDEVNNRLGVGTASPLNLLHVKGSSPVRIIADTTGQYAVFNLYKNGVETGAWYADDTNKKVLFEMQTGWDFGFNRNGGTRAATIKDNTGAVLINTTTDDTVNKLQVNGSAKATQYNLSALNAAPASATATGTLGEIRWADGFVYLCVATNSWQRAALAAW